MIDALKRASAGSIVAVIPYFGYARQDRKSQAAHADHRRAGRRPAHRGRRRPRAGDGPARRPDPGLLQHPVRSPVRDAGADGVPAAAASTTRRSSSRPTPAASSARAPSPSAWAPAWPSSTSGGPAPNVAEVMNIIGDVQGPRRHHRRRHDRHRRHAVRRRPGGHGRRARARSTPAPATACSRGPAIERINESPLEEVVITDTIPPRPDVSACPKIKVLQRRAPARRGDQAHPPRRLDQLAVHLNSTTPRRKRHVMDFAKVTVEVRTETGKGGARKVARARARSRACSTAARTSRSRSRFDPQALVRVAGQGAQAQHRLHADDRRRRPAGANRSPR